MNKTCAICKLPIETEEPAIIGMGAYGTPKCICNKCERIIDTATKAMNTTEAENAIRVLGETLTKGNTSDPQIISTVNEIIKTAAERVEGIRNGTYDFSKDEEAEPEFEISEDMEETEEDKALDEKEAKTAKLIDTITSWIAGAAILGTVIYFIVKFIF